MSEPQAPATGALPPPASPLPASRPGWTWKYRRGGRGGLWFPIALIGFGVIARLDQFGLLWWVRWEVIWPLVLIALGVALILRRWR